MFREWDEKREPDWDLLKMPAHNSFHRYVGELNSVYLKRKAVWEFDHTYDGFKWVDCRGDNKCVFAYTRAGKGDSVLVILNFSDKEASIAPELDGRVTLLLNTDWELFGGKTKKTIKRAVPKTILPFTGLLFTYQRSSALE